MLRFGGAAGLYVADSRVPFRSCDTPCPPWLGVSCGTARHARVARAHIARVRACVRAAPSPLTPALRPPHGYIISTGTRPCICTAHTVPTPEPDYSTLNPQMKVGFFLHTPFPSSEIYRTLPVGGSGL